MSQHSSKTTALVAALGLSALSMQAQLNLHMGNSLTISDAAGDYSGPVAPGLWDVGYVNNGMGGAPGGPEVYAGAFNVTIVNNTTGGASFNLLTFCTDIDVYWMANGQSSQAYKVMNFSTSTGVDPTWPAGTKAVQNAAWIYNTQFLPNAGTMNNYQAAAIQLAIWAALYDTEATGVNAGKLDSTTVTAGEFQESGFNSQTVTDANNILSALQAVAGTSATSGYNEYWLAPVNGSGQVAALSQGLIAPMPVPEPTTLIAGALLMLPFGASTLRFLRKNRAE
jgi:hypothetical protein